MSHNYPSPPLLLLFLLPIVLFLPDMPTQHHSNSVDSFNMTTAPFLFHLYSIFNQKQGKQREIMGSTYKNRLLEQYFSPLVDKPDYRKGRGVKWYMGDSAFLLVQSCLLEIGSPRMAVYIKQALCLIFSQSGCAESHCPLVALTHMTSWHSIMVDKWSS